MHACSLRLTGLLFLRQLALRDLDSRLQKVVVKQASSLRQADGNEAHAAGDSTAPPILANGSQQAPIQSL